MSDNAHGSQIITAIKALCEEKKVPEDTVIEGVEAALASAYKKEFGKKKQKIEVKLGSSGSFQVFELRLVVEGADEEGYVTGDIEWLKKQQEEQEAQHEYRDFRVEEKPKEEAEKTETSEEEEKDGIHFDQYRMITLEEARATKPDAKVGDELRLEQIPPDEFGRMAAQTAKQVLVQKLREAEREVIFSLYEDKEGTVVTGTVQRQEGRTVFVDLGRTVAIMPVPEQIRTESYPIGKRMKVYVKSVDMGPRGALITVSRADSKLVEELFIQEVPEIEAGNVEIKAIARETGGRTKIAVWAEDTAIDPIGACVGQKGARVQTIIDELGGEKIDIIEWDEDLEEFIIKALQPAQVNRVELSEEKKTGVAIVNEDQQSLAIGREGQNVRLASKLTGIKLDIQADGASSDEDGESADSQEGESADGVSEDAKSDKSIKSDKSDKSDREEEEEDGGKDEAGSETKGEEDEKESEELDKSDKSDKSN